MAEPPGRGTITTVQLPRKTFSGRPRDWTGGYAVPDYIMAESSGRGAVHTYPLRRKTITQRIPESLGAVSAPAFSPGFPGDPIKSYGARASEYIMATIREVPDEFRVFALEALLNEVEPGLYDRVTNKANEYEAKGMRPKAAVKAALASQMSKGFAEELLKIGSRPGPRVRSQVGLSYYGDVSYSLALDGFFSSIKGAVKKVASAIEKAASTTGRGIKKAASATGRGVKRGATTVARGVTYPVRKLGQGISKGADYVKQGAQKVLEWGEKAIDKLGSLACGALSHPAGAVAAGAAAGAAGAPPQIGMVAAEIGKGVCGKSDTPPATPQELMEPQGYGGASQWLLPAAIGGGVLLVALALRK
jgi:hypothetical protein